MENDRIIGIFIMVLSAFIFIPLIIFFFSYGGVYTYKTFMETFGTKLSSLKLEHSEEERIRSAFEKVFHKYSDSSAIGSLGLYLLSFFINTIIFGLIIVMLILQCKCCCENSMLGKTICSSIMLVVAILVAIIYDYIALDIEYKLGLRDDEIYMFDDEFNQEIRENLDDIYNKRKKIFYHYLIGEMFSFQ